MAIVRREDYFDGALTILATEGFGALRMNMLCRSLGVTSGSFYNYFRDWKDFIDQFLQSWEEQQTLRLAEQAEANTDPVGRLEQLREFARGVPHDAEVAIRVWSTVDTRVAETQNEVDRQRIELIHHAVNLLVPDPAISQRLAELALSIVIGQQHLGSKDMDWALRQFIGLVHIHAQA